MQLSKQREKNLRTALGFTLLELVIVMMIIGMALGLSIKFFILNSADRVLKETSKDIELLARRARTIAVIQQTPYAITITESGLRMGPLAEAKYNSEALQQRLDLEENQTTKPKMPPIRDSLSLSQFAISLRPFAAVKYIPVDPNDQLIWRFDPNGLCEPIGIRLEYDDGWCEAEFHPISATIRDYSQEARR